MTTYDEYLAELKLRTSAAYAYVPKMCNALKDEGLSKEDVKDRVTKDCLEAGLSKSTITHYIPEEFKDTKKVEAGKKGAVKKKELEMLTDGSVLQKSEAGSSPESPKEPDSGSYSIDTSDKYNKDYAEENPLNRPKEWQPLPVTKPDEEFLAHKVNDLMNELDALKVENKKILEINKIQAEELKAVVKHKTIDPMIDKDVDCTNHSMYIKAQVLVEKERVAKQELQDRIDALDKVVFAPATDVVSPPDMFQVPKEADGMTTYFYTGKSPVQAMGLLRQILNSVTKIDIGWRVLE